MDSHSEGRKKFMKFPYASGPVRDLMVDLVSAVENRLDSQLLLKLLFKSDPASSPYWGASNITSLSDYMSSSTDALNFLIELIQNSPTSLVLILDLPPRKDLVLHPYYLHTFYESTLLDKHMQMLEKVPEVRPYFSSSFYIRCVLSPIAIMVHIETEAGESTGMEEILRSHVNHVAKEVIGIINQCACGGREIRELDKAYLEKRDGLIKNKTIEIDLGSSLPRFFGLEVAGRVLGGLQKFLTASGTVVGS